MDLLVVPYLIKENGKYLQVKSILIKLSLYSDTEKSRRNLETRADLSK